jgi:hypothetical protein
MTEPEIATAGIGRTQKPTSRTAFAFETRSLALKVDKRVADPDGTA